ncbi:fibronectin type III domain-containing protein [Actinokineospora iranica]|uniref:Fibronectin type 3 domain-containing protein n=1 Tax=Actinokineospora iranica TaxID=1271860 RepID=A0A1G6NDU2_9PSEU|nr:fibronectin type III domain-containing protein [Actinokineospora iranica]SDC66000.1 fibronectin type 3 domain-containing protein [Actinokineospora iranica]
MRPRRPTRRLTTGVAVLGTAAMVAAGIMIGSGTSSAAQGELAQTYSCPLPLIGNQNVSVNIKTTQPSTITTGKFTPQIEITAVSNAGSTATQGLRLVGAESIKGVARATSTVKLPGSQGELTVQVPTEIPNQPIPAVGNDLVLNAVGSAPALRFDEPGTASLSVDDLVLEMTPLRADGTPTDLGTFTADCTPAPGQDTLLQTYEVTGPSVAPEATVGVGNVPPLKQVYSCPFPLIGNQTVTVDINTNALPTKVKAGEFTPAIDITAVSNAGSTATQGLRLVGAETIQGTALATSLVSAPQGHLAVGVSTAVPNQPIPPTGNDLVVNAKGAAPALQFTKPGTATLSVHDLVLTMTPLRANGTPTDLGTFVADCTPTDGQNNVLHTFTVEGAADTVAPTQVTGVTVGETTENSIALSWAPSTDAVGVTGYEVRYGNGQTKAVTGTSATIDGLTEDTEYTFTVVAKDAAGNVSDPSAAVVGKTKAGVDGVKPTTPGNLHSTNVTQTSVALAWDASSDNVGVTGYDVLYGNGQTKSVTEPSATIEGLTAKTEYSFTVVAKDAAGNVSDASAPLAVTTLEAPDTEAPSAPAGLNSTGASDTSIGLAWDASTDNVAVTGYEVRYGNGQTKAVTETSTTIEGLTEDTEYTFTVVAKDAAGNVSEASAPLTVKTKLGPDTVKPSVPTGLSVTGVTQSSVSLAWVASTDNVGVTGYDVLYGNGQTKSVEGTEATVDGLQPGTDYSFTVVAKDAAGNKSDPSAAANTRTEPTPDITAPTAPSNVRSTDVTETSVALAWDASSDDTGVTGYEVFNGANSVATVTGTSATVSGLTADTEYTFTVKAKDAAGNVSDPSAGFTVRTDKEADIVKPTAPTNLTATGTTDSSVSLVWDAATDNVGVTGYQVFSGTAPVASGAGTAATVAGLNPDTEYTFTVVAKDAAGNVSEASAPLTVKTKAREIPDVIKYGYDLSGKTVLKKLPGTVKLSGGVAASVNPATGAFEADLALNPTHGNFRIWGIFPVSAKVEFLPVGKTTGALTGGVLKSTSNVTVKLSRLTLLGFPITTGSTCQTKTPVNVPLQSKPGFDPTVGGLLTGTYTLPPLQGCGSVTSALTDLTAGPGNTIEVNLKAKPTS